MAAWQQRRKEYLLRKAAPRAETVQARPDSREEKRKNLAAAIRAAFDRYGFAEISSALVKDCFPDPCELSKWCTLKLGCTYEETHGGVRFRPVMGVQRVL